MHLTRLRATGTDVIAECSGDETMSGVVVGVCLCSPWDRGRRPDSGNTNAAALASTSPTLDLMQFIESSALVVELIHSFILRKLMALPLLRARGARVCVVQVVDESRELWGEKAVLFLQQKFF